VGHKTKRRTTGRSLQLRRLEKRSKELENTCFGEERIMVYAYRRGLECGKRTKCSVRQAAHSDENPSLVGQSGAGEGAAGSGGVGPRMEPSGAEERADTFWRSEVSVPSGPTGDEVGGLEDEEAPAAGGSADL